MPVCAIYARVSDDSQLDGESIEHQISFVREFVRRRSLEEREQWITPDNNIFVDEAASGTSLLKRTAAQRLIQAAREHQFEIVLFKGISRFARDTVDALLMLRTLQTSGVRVVSLEENFDSRADNAEFIFTIHSALAQAESEKIGIRVRIGAMEKARSGKWNGPPPEGYVLNKSTQKLQVDEISAATIRHVFQLYLQGYGVRRIANQLNAMGLFTACGNRWSHRNIARVLRNPAYAGDVVYGRRQPYTTLSPDNPMQRRKRVQWTLNGEHIAVCRNAHPAIIDRQAFEQVGILLAQRRTTPGRSGGIHLLSQGLLRCSCGSRMSVKWNGRGTAYYRCRGQAQHGQSYCSLPYLRVQDVEQVVLAQLWNDIEARLTDEPVRVEAETTQPENRLVALNGAIRRELARFRTLFDKYTEGTVSEEQFVALNETIQRKLSTLNDMRAQTDGQGPEAQVSGGGHVSYRNQLQPFFSTETPDRTVTRRLLETLVGEVRIADIEATTVALDIVYKFASPHMDD